MSDTSSEQFSPPSLLRRYSVRIALWLTVLLTVIIYRACSDAGLYSDIQSQRFRLATTTEWQQDIATLGEERLAKEVSWLFIRHDLDHDYQGRLVWWHDGNEHLSYLPRPDEEDPRASFLQLIGDLRHGRGGQPPPVVLQNVHGDDALSHRILTLANEEPPPPGWTILRAPDQR